MCSSSLARPNFALISPSPPHPPRSRCSLPAVMPSYNSLSRSTATIPIRAYPSLGKVDRVADYPRFCLRYMDSSKISLRSDIMIHHSLLIALEKRIIERSLSLKWVKQRMRKAVQEIGDPQVLPLRAPAEHEWWSEQMRACRIVPSHFASLRSYWLGDTPHGYFVRS